MIDNVNPTSQFHPYQPVTSTPHTDRPSGLDRLLEKVGVDRSRIDAMSSRMNTSGMRDQLNRARGMAANNSGMVLGGLAALAIGAGLMRRRSMSKVAR